MREGMLLTRKILEENSGDSSAILGYLAPSIFMGCLSAVMYSYIIEVQKELAVETRNVTAGKA